MRDAADELVFLYSKKPGFVCLTCLEGVAYDYNVSIKTIPIQDVTIFDNDIIWYLIDDKEFNVDNERNSTLRFVVEQ